MIIDINSYYGRLPYWDTPIKNFTQFKNKFTSYNINKVFVTSLRSIFVDWFCGNEEVNKLSDNIKYIPSFSLNPIYLKESLNLIKKYPGNLFRFYPYYHGYNQDNENLGKIIMELNKRRSVCLIPVRLFMNWGLPVLSIMNYEKYFKNYKNVNYIISGINYPEISTAENLLDKYKNVFIETSCLTLMNGIERLCKLCSSKKIIFGSGFCLQYVTCGIEKIRNSEISNKDKDNIFYKNINRILGPKKNGKS